MKYCFSRKKNMIKKSTKENIEKVIEDFTKSDLIPFLEREKPIIDLNSLCDRIKELNKCIDQCKKDIDWAERKLGEDSTINVSGGVWELLTEEDSKNIDNIIKKRIRSYISQQKDLIHTCQDELDWLQMKIGIGPDVGNNRFKTGAFNFDPHKDHC